MVRHKEEILWLLNKRRIRPAVPGCIDLFVVRAKEECPDPSCQPEEPCAACFTATIGAPPIGWEVDKGEVTIIT